MASEWVGQTVTGLTALAGIAATAYTSARGHKHAEILATNARQNLLADRRYAEQREAYLGLLQHIERLTVRSVLHLTGAKEDLEKALERARQPEYIAQTEAMMAHFRAFSSPEVAELVDDWESVRTQVIRAGRNPEDLRRANRAIRSRIHEELGEMG